MTEDNPQSPSRRRWLAISAGATGLAAATAAAGAYGGAAAAQKPARIVVDGRRRFEGKVVLVTGATSGIGRAAAEQFAAEGAKVAFCGRREALGAEVEAAIRAAGGEASYIRADVRLERDVRDFVSRAVALYGGVDVAFNNAGITVERPLHELSAEEYDDVQNTNVRGVFLAMKYQIPHMMEKGGAIVVTSSRTAISSSAKRSAYAASKRALIGLVQGAVHDYPGGKIRINALLPGTTDTDFIRRLAGFADAPDAAGAAAGNMWAKNALPAAGRMATADEMAAMALMLASDEHPYLNGVSLDAHGGETP